MSLVYIFYCIGHRAQRTILDKAQAVSIRENMNFKMWKSPFQIPVLIFIGCRPLARKLKPPNIRCVTWKIKQNKPPPTHPSRTVVMTKISNNICKTHAIVCGS